MSLTQLAERYLTLLVSQMEGDAKFLSTGWVITSIVPFLVYFVAALLKWYILLAPITVPLTCWPTVSKIASVKEFWLKDKAKKN